MYELVDQVVPLDDVWAKIQTTLLPRLDPKASPSQLFRRTEETLLSLTQTDFRERPVSVAVARLQRVSGSLMLSELAQEAGWSLRQLERRFRVEVGFGPKMLARILRFQSLLKELRHPRPVQPSWADLALHMGFADQAHMIREFRAFSGITPTRFLQRSDPLLEAIFEPSLKAGSCG